MALMKFRESNQVLWRGVRPGHNGTFVSKGDVTGVVAWLNIYTVPAGQTLYITHSAICVMSVATAGSALMRVFTGGAGHYIHVLYPSAAASVEMVVDTSHYFPIEVESGGTVDIRPSAVGIICYGLFNGFLQAN